MRDAGAARGSRHALRVLDHFFAARFFRVVRFVMIGEDERRRRSKQFLNCLRYFPLPISFLSVCRTELDRQTERNAGPEVVRTQHVFELQSAIRRILVRMVERPIVAACKIYDRDLHHPLRNPTFCSPHAVPEQLRVRNFHQN